eukprot:TRINITY_DN4378_c0_g1_i1.p2 TRINITY_DN4378_c0_g1~~TRINITY_DN4378_c0_g1_i1.p2  ORF type:complete len:147 (+),score=7.96 TRINITY_DN4378_c0_g1_i1:465-905(+)
MRPFHSQTKRTNLSEMREYLVNNKKRDLPLDVRDVNSHEAIASSKRVTRHQHINACENATKETKRRSLIRDIGNIINKSVINDSAAIVKNNYMEMHKQKEADRILLPGFNSHHNFPEKKKQISPTYMSSIVFGTEKADNKSHYTKY